MTYEAESECRSWGVSHNCVACSTEVAGDIPYCHENGQRRSETDIESFFAYIGYGSWGCRRIPVLTG